ncbi:MAG: hypothetical protein H0V93_07065 [Euzebyales bacterium]|jgi:hypothetical protein|nr:hypothetical protein [Euzebyales bacterium]
MTTDEAKGHPTPDPTPDPTRHPTSDPTTPAARSADHWRDVALVVLLPLGALFALALFGGILLSLAADGAISVLPAIGGIFGALLGGRVTVGCCAFVGIVPLTLVAVLGLLWAQWSRTRAFLPTAQGWLTAAGLSALAWLLAGVFAQVIGSIGAEGEVVVRARPLAQLAAGALVWLIAAAITHLPEARRVLVATLLGAAVVGVITLLAVLTSDAAGDIGAGAALVLILVTSLVAVNTLLLVVAWAFGAPIDLGPTSQTFIAAAGENGALWLLPLALVLAVAAYALLRAPAQDARAFRVRVLRFGVIAYVVLTVGLLVGQGVVDTIGTGGLLGAGVGVQGLPVSTLLAALTLAGVLAAAEYLHAARRGGWARLPDLAAATGPKSGSARTDDPVAPAILSDDAAPDRTVGRGVVPAPPPASQDGVDGAVPAVIPSDQHDRPEDDTATVEHQAQPDATVETEARADTPVETEAQADTTVEAEAQPEATQVVEPEDTTQVVPASPEGGRPTWTCAQCGFAASGRFCAECGTPRAAT